MRVWASTIAKLGIALIAGVMAFWFVPGPLPEMSRAEFMNEVRAGHVRRVEIRDQKVIPSQSTARGPFRTEFDRVRDAELPDELRALGVEVRFSKSSLGV
jgi:hypothetical protein